LNGVSSSTDIASAVITSATFQRLITRLLDLRATIGSRRVRQVLPVLLTSSDRANNGYPQGRQVWMGGTKGPNNVVRADRTGVFPSFRLRQQATMVGVSDQGPEGRRATPLATGKQRRQAGAAVKGGT
jgi:hypothetical protein